MTTTTPVLVDLDPRDLDVETNVRVVLGDIDALTASVRVLGVLEPLLVTPADESGRHRVIAGKRRRAAAIKADLATVPCIIRDDLAEGGMDTAAGLVENIRRQDLSDGEEAAAYEQLRLAGWTQARMVAATGTKRARVRQALQVARNGTASAVAQRYPITLDQAAAIGEFESDPEQVKALTVLAVKDPGQFDHALSRARRDRDRQAAYDTAVEALRADGVAVADDDEDEPAHVVRLTALTHDGEPLTPENHADCPGHIAAVAMGWEDQPTVTFGCTDPDAYGHRDRFGDARPQQGSGPMTEEQKAERRTVIANNRAWKDAEPVRLAHVKNVLLRATPPRGTLRYVTGEIVAGPEMVARATDGDVAAIFGACDDGRSWGRGLGVAVVDDMPDKRLPLVLLAQVAAAVERSMSPATWRHRDPTAARYLRFLTSTGYTLSDVEEIVVDLDTDEDTNEDTDEDTDTDGEEDAAAA